MAAESGQEFSARLVTGLQQALMTAVAACISNATTALVHLPDGFWAAISAIVVMQTDLAATANSGRDRFIGTAIGGLIGWGCAVYWHDQLWILGLAIAVSVFVCWLANLGTAGRLSAVTLTVIVLIPRGDVIWKVALFRFLEVSWGIAVALAVSWLVAAGERLWRAR